MGSDDDNRFTEDERITQNLRLRSISPAGRTFLAFFAFVPPRWRGPLAILLCGIIGFLASQSGTKIIDWLINK